MRILVAEDDAALRVLLESHLTKWGYEVLAARDGREAWTILQGEDAPRLAVLDWTMPERDGPAICHEIRQQTDRPYVYIILLTARDDKEDLIRGLEFGADDYLTKPFHPRELRARLAAGRRILELEDRLVATCELLQFNATHDALTALWNRGTILDLLERELARAGRESSPLGLILLDLDHFKQINDTHGHLAGDEVLQEVARRLTGAVRAYDAVGRFGGEEFLALLPGCDPQVVRERANRLLKTIGESPVTTSTGELTVTASIGALCTTQLANITAKRLLRIVDIALYRAKDGGRNRMEMEMLSGGELEEVPA